MRITTVLLAVVAIVGCKDSKVAVDLQGVPPATQSQRYQIIINPHPFNGSNTQAFLIDTERGRIWEYNPFTDGKEPRLSNFSEVNIIDEEGALGPTLHAFNKLHEMADQRRSESQRGAKITE